MMDEAAGFPGLDGGSDVSWRGISLSGSIVLDFPGDEPPLDA
ncbi:hypothetical protein BMS3Abin02_02067 [bacterium BMS3Abin02]|nr:hypothetical protein BMS3Abin02_02067 [bacterium BMS3Abin02]GBE21008.1 hypothetical protein BMS3Bbin01_00349 [bacterium BMS3Bbin01]